MVTDILTRKIDIVDYAARYTELTFHGKDYRGKCPVHSGEKANSFCVSPQKGIYHCFACGSAGNVVNLKADIEKISYMEAVAKLCDEYDIEPDEEYKRQRQIVDKNEAFIRAAENQISSVRDYLHGRGFNDETIKNFRFGYENGALIIPIHDEHGRCVAVSKRFFDPTAPSKYVNSKASDVWDKSCTLFNMHRARRVIRNKLFVVEGYLDAASGDQLGLPTVAYMSADISRQQVELIAKWLDTIKSAATIILAPDNDYEGQKRIPRLREKFKQYASKLNVRVMQFPDEIKDFNDALKAGINIEELPNVHIDRYCLERVLNQCADVEAEYGVAFGYMKSVYDQMVRLDLSEFLAKRWGKTQADIRSWLNVSAKSPDEVLSEFTSPGAGFDAYADMLTEGTLELGFAGLDKSLNFVRRSEVVIYGAYPSVGKTWLAIHAALHNVRKKKKVLFVSLEMSAASLYERIIAMILGMPTDKLEEEMKAGDNVKLLSIRAKIEQTLSEYLYVIDSNDLSIDDIAEKIKAINMFGDAIDLVIIDYIQYLRAISEPGSAVMSRVRRLKGLAKEHNCIVLALSQLNREGNVFQRPTFKMLRGGGDLEATGDIIVLFWKPGEDNKLTLQEQYNLKDIISCCVEKARRGARVKEFELKIDEKKSRIYEK